MTAFMLAILIIAAFGLAFMPRGVKAAPEKPWLEVKPNYYMTSKMEPFNVSVWLNDIKKENRSIGVQFDLLYNDTLLEVETVTEGSFWKDPAWAPFGTVFVSQVEPPHVLVADLILPNETGGAHWDVFPDGSGEIATITFNGKYPQGNCKLELKGIADVMLIDDKYNPIPTALPTPGYYEIWPLLCDVNRDKRVDILDVVLVAKAFGSFPGDPRWNPRYDTNRDEKIDILDLAIFRVYFGKWIP